MKTWLRFVGYQGDSEESLLLICDVPVPPVGSHIWIYGIFYAVKEHVYEYGENTRWVEVRIQNLPTSETSPTGNYKGSK